MSATPETVTTIPGSCDDEIPCHGWLDQLDFVMTQRHAALGSFSAVLAAIGDTMDRLLVEHTARARRSVPVPILFLDMADEFERLRQSPPSPIELLDMALELALDGSEGDGHD